MKDRPLNAALTALARRVIWFEEPDKALADPVRFTAYVLTNGMYEDVEQLRSYTGDGGLRDALQSAPPGIFDGPSWAYWNLKYGS